MTIRYMLIFSGNTFAYGMPNIKIKTNRSLTSFAGEGFRLNKTWQLLSGWEFCSQAHPVLFLIFLFFLFFFIEDMCSTL